MLCFFAEVCDFVCMQFPVFSIERFNNEFFWFWTEATNIDVVAIGIGAGNIERLYTARFTEPVLGNPGIKLVSRKIFFTL